MNPFAGRAPTTDPPAPDPEPPKGSLAIWSTYYDQADPLVVYYDGAWNNITIDQLRELLNGKELA